MLGRLAGGYLSFKGRIGRKSYWLRSASAGFVVGLLGLCALGLRPSSPAGFVLLSALAIGLGAWISASLVVRRFHDHGRNGWAGLGALAAGAAIGSLGQYLGVGLPAMTLASVVGLALFVYLGFVRGTKGDNAYGADPAGG
ncbi:DUF805 domain-containing protein [Hansschlegelia zhihuaiae]|uniref:DUF805 domain-containing protein n=1 Tax=Hansschlegelia zhihuaiae TaxID=405005 RepID=A0A4Q0MJ76_9HYPH|nr:DUF805 domain-containing protein [Hansschlegelia zhihuaiae]RXF73433.1 DUF805 domain-containing protein [Hansschlegelia zhihuaiae]